MMRTTEGKPLSGTGYHVVRRIGVGASSEVFEVVGDRGEIRALKLLREVHATSREVSARLVREGRALSALDHRHLVKVEEVGVTADGRPYLVMPRLRGETLRDRIDARGPLPAAAAAGFAAEVLRGLDAAHRAGVVHRDVKPANVFLVRATPLDFEHAVLLDFGIAKVSGVVVDPTTGQHIIGTPRYLSPEQILGGAVDGRTDVYAMGLVLFEAIAGRSPFPAADALGLMRAHIHTAAPRLRKLAPVTAALERVVARALEKGPAQRFQTAWEMAEALDDAREAELARGARQRAAGGAR